MGISLGACLKSAHDETEVTIISSKRVRMGPEEMSLTAATRHVLGLEYSVAPAPHWTYQGRLLREIYEETYGEPE